METFCRVFHFVFWGLIFLVGCIFFIICLPIEALSELADENMNRY